MSWRGLVLIGALVPACSFVAVKDVNEATLNDPQVPVSCTTSRIVPLVDLLAGAILGGLVFAATYAAVDGFNDDVDCGNGGCYHPWKPATLGTFLVVSPWWISSAVGFADTGRCRDVYRSRGMPIR
jgi:hypothetical protein